MIREYHKNKECLTCETFDTGHNLLCYQSYYVSTSSRRDNYFAINYGMSRAEYLNEIYLFRRYLSSYLYDGFFEVTSDLFSD